MPTKISENARDFPKICIIGAGFSGICAGVQIKKQLGIDSFTIFDLNEDVGGTWLVNKYPGCCCDIPSHVYSLSFELNPDWPETHSSSDEIWKYVSNIAKKYDLYPLIKFKHEVRTLVWDETIRKWKVTVVNLNEESPTPQTHIFDIVINGPGGIRVPKYPEEFMSFKGPIIHSAEWDSSVELKDKVVAVVGSGATAVQVVPAISDKVKKLVVYQRNPPYAIERQQMKFTPLRKFIFKYVPLANWLYRCFYFLFFELLWMALKPPNYFSRMVARDVTDKLNKDLKDENLREKFIPNYEFGCKRFTVTDDYFTSFLKPNVKLQTNTIVEVTPDSIKTQDGEEEKIEVLILATGYSSQAFFAPLRITGVNGEDVLKTWQNDAPSAYYGIISHTMPNHFMLLGPNTLLGNNSVLFMLECQVNFTMSVIKKMIETGKKVVSSKPEVEAEYMKKLREDMKPLAWSKPCNAWYKNPRGVVTGTYPLPCSVYWWKTRKVNFKDLDLS